MRKTILTLARLWASPSLAMATACPRRLMTITSEPGQGVGIPERLRYRDLWPVHGERVGPQSLMQRQQRVA